MTRQEKETVQAETVTVTWYLCDLCGQEVREENASEWTTLYREPISAKAVKVTDGVGRSVIDTLRPGQSRDFHPGGGYTIRVSVPDQPEDEQDADAIHLCDYCLNSMEVNDGGT